VRDLAPTTEATLRYPAAAWVSGQILTVSGGGVQALD
jgi:hypothetical protein